MRRFVPRCHYDDAGLQRRCMRIVRDHIFGRSVDVRAIKKITQEIIPEWPTDPSLLTAEQLTQLREIAKQLKEEKEHARYGTTG